MVGTGAPVFVIAEIGTNHNGSLERAKRLIDAASRAGADAVKFQKRALSATYQQQVLDHPELYEQSFQYLIPLLQEFELSESAFVELKEYAKARGLLFFASAFDETSVDFLARNINPPTYKVASADLTNLPLFERLVREDVPLIVSTGMSSLDELDETVAFLHGKRKEFILLHTHSAYPAAAADLNLAMITKLKKRYGVPVGYSGHELGMFQTIQAVTLGAVVVERHITEDRMLPGPDHIASLEPEQFKELVREIRAAHAALGIAVKRISRGEVGNRMTLRKSLVAAQAIPTGTKITRAMVTSKSPGIGLSPQRLYDLVGTVAQRGYQADEMFTDADLHEDTALPRAIPTPHSVWGLKARFAEIEALGAFKPTPKLLEFHASEQDLLYPFDTTRRYPQELYVHAPEYWGREPVDLASEDDRLWKQSIEVMQKTIDKARVIAQSFTGIPKIVIHVGGMTVEKHPNPHRLFERSLEAFRQLDVSGVEPLPENLPPYGWFFSGLWHCNIFGAATEMIEFCDALNLKMCLDLSHAWLYCTDRKIDFLGYVAQVAPYVRHLHVSDGRGSHKEGLQIGEGDVPFGKTFEILEEASRGKHVISWVPEIWQGHLHSYREFKIALAKLHEYPFLQNAHE